LRRTRVEEVIITILCQEDSGLMEIFAIGFEATLLSLESLSRTMTTRKMQKRLGLETGKLCWTLEHYKQEGKGTI
jgi:hypothetical protein